jgi:O-antigen/teichoic acid export membrane protein
MAKNSIWIFTGQGLSLIAQAIYFIVIARLLGTFQYGLFVGAAASVSIVSQYSSLGSGLLFLRHVSPHHSRFPQYWGNILLSTLSLGTVLVVLLAIASPWFLHGTATRLVVLLAIGECICGQLTIAMSQIFQAFEKMRYTAVLSLLTTCARMLIAVAMLLTLHHANASQWVIASLSVSLAATIAGVVLVTTHFGLPVFQPRLFFERVREGLVFAVSGSTASVYNDVDKAMLAHFGMNAANGIYTMAYRIIDIGTIPIRSVHAAAFPRFFRHGATSGGLKATEQFARKLLRRTSLLGLAAALLMFFGAPIIPHIVGKGFAPSVMALRWLCPIPFFRSFQLSAADALAGAGKQSWRLTGQLLAAAVNVGLNLYLIPRYSWQGAAWANLITDALLGVTLWSIVAGMNHALQRVRPDDLGIPLEIEALKI